MDLSLDEGAKIVGFARKVIELDFEGVRAEGPEGLGRLFRENRGVFVTLHTHPGGKLRGCIGYPEPVMELGRALRESALSAAFHDPRFPHVKKDEVRGLVIEVSVLTPPEEIKVGKPLDIPGRVRVGVDGLIVRSGWASGLLLPQVPVEQGWDAKEFLSHACLKAGLSPDAWLAGGVRLFKFGAQIFYEKEPGGEVAEKKLC